MGLSVVLTGHGDEDLVIQDSIEVWQMLTAPASSSLLFSTPWGPKKPLFYCLGIKESVELPIRYA